LAKSKEREELFIDADILVSENISASEIMLLQSHFSELLKDVLMQVEQEKE
jgi:hypothetical protein